MQTGVDEWVCRWGSVWGLGILYWGAEKSRILLTYLVEVYIASIGWRWGMLVVLWRCSVQCERWRLGDGAWGATMGGG